ncbi:cation-translocating P-type ATPase [Kushneria phosphatilytica]|nr:HAD-IC family P-type ATPase [Kushneria phosphatilytica]
MESRQWHALTRDAVLSELDSVMTGLSSVQVAARLRDYGANRLPEPPKRSLLRRFLLQFHNVLIHVLLGSALVTALLGHVVDTAVILGVVFINAAIGLVQEYRAERALAAISDLLAPYANVLRDGGRCSVRVEDLVPGDIVLLSAGDRVPADLRVLRSHGLGIQEAMLTGESLTVEKHTDPVFPAVAVAERSCMAFGGTLVVSGQGVGVVVATGTDTEMGRISHLLGNVTTLTTPLVRQMNVFARRLTVVILSLALVVLALGHFIWHYPFSDLFIAVVGLSVAAIPEGLPAVMTITLALGARAMARRNAVVRHLPAIETLSSVSVICTDKTGTLTRNEMVASELVTVDECLVISGEGYAPDGEIRSAELRLDPQTRPGLQELAQVAALCNDAALQNSEGSWRVEGDPMEGALLALAARLGVTRAKAQQQWIRTDVLPFEAEHRYMATLHHDHEGHARLFIKGAPERVLAMCRRVRTADGGEAYLDDNWWQARIEALAARGQRVLALASRMVPASQTVLARADVEGGIVLLGLVALMDPPRPEAVAAIAECQRAGIGVRMITGDHATTAAAIGRMLGLARTQRVITGAELDTMNDGELGRAVMETDIFARTSPEHKLRLVTALQAHGLTVAMTGDGVNDAPALKRADVGIAMGRKGSEAAREAADIVLADDNFASIVAAVREGRTVNDNITRVIGWTLPTSAGEAATIMAALLLGMVLPVTPVQILWVNLITAVTLGVALAFEPGERSAMQRPPRSPHAPLLGWFWLWHIVLVTLLFLAGVFGVYAWAIGQGHDIALARTMAMNTLIMMEIAHLFFIRSIHAPAFSIATLRGTRAVWSAIAIVVMAQCAMIWVPPLQAIFDTRAIPFFEGLLIPVVGVLLLLAVETERQLRRRMKKHWHGSIGHHASK